jgi:hypothetical protein
MSKAKAVDNERMLYAVLAAFVVVMGIVIYEYVYATPSTATQPVVVSAPQGAASAATPVVKKTGMTAAALDPTLHMEAMEVSEAVEYSGSGRNIFSPDSAPPVVIPPPVAPPRPKMAPVAVYVPPPIPTGPPPPPPIDLKFFGIAETHGNGERTALLLHGDSVFIAKAGDVVLRRYRILAVDAKTIQVEDMQNNNRQTLPLLVN